MFTMYEPWVDGELSRLSAAVALPPLFEAWAPITSVVDFGCGTGAWLTVATDLGAPRCVGIDGPAAKSPGELVVHDLCEPLDLGERFDLAICLEVAEHLPDTAADTLVASITAHSDLVLFSAATPGQSGHGHINLQPHSYWDARFDAAGYRMTSVVVAPDMARWYRDNLRLFVREEVPHAA